MVEEQTFVDKGPSHTSLEVGDCKNTPQAYNGLVLHVFPFPLRHTKYACCVIEQNDGKIPVDGVQGVCDTPLHHHAIRGSRVIRNPVVV